MSDNNEITDSGDNGWWIVFGLHEVGAVLDSYIADGTPFDLTHVTSELSAASVNAAELELHHVERKINEIIGHLGVTEPVQNVSLAVEALKVATRHAEDFYIAEGGVRISYPYQV